MQMVQDLDIYSKHPVSATASYNDFIKYRNFNLKHGVILPHTEDNYIWRNKTLRSEKGQKRIKQEILNKLDKYGFLFEHKIKKS